VLATVILGGLVLLPGIPIALVVGRADEPRRWSGVLVEALLLGSCWWMLLGLWFSHAGWLAPWQLLLPTLVVTAAAWVVALPQLARTRVGWSWFATFMTVVSVAAVWLRSEPFYFLFQIADFGEYVNRANVVADGGGFAGWFTQGFSVALSLSHLALGEGSTVDLMPFLGIVLLWVTVELARRLGAPRGAQALIAVVLAVGEVPVWFGRFPASETLYAVLQVGLVLLVVTAVQRGSRRLATAAGVVCGLLLVTRGNAILLGPIVVLAVLLGSLVASKRTLDVLCRWAWAALLSLGVAFAFNARFSHPYFIAEQLPKFVPDRLFRQLEGMGGLRFAAPRFVLLVAGTWALVRVARWLHGRLAPEHLAIVLGLLVVGGIVALEVKFETAGLFDALGRYNIAVELLGAVGLVAALWRFRSFDDGRRLAVIMVVLVGGAFTLLYADRFARPRYAPYHLYWDRYLFSEVFPLMVLASMWAVIEIGRRVPPPVIGAAVLGLAVWLYASSALIREHVFMDDAYEQLHAIADDVEPNGFVFVGIPPAEVPRALCHPNTHRIVASPLVETFDRPMLSHGLRAFGPDPLPDAVDVEAILATQGVAHASIVQVVAEGDEPAPLDTGAATVDDVREHPLRIPMLDRPLAERSSDPLASCNAQRQSQPRWRVARFTVFVSRVSA
jgi:hypothetical protein